MTPFGSRPIGKSKSWMISYADRESSLPAAAVDDVANGDRMTKRARMAARDDMVWAFGFSLASLSPNFLLLLVFFRELLLVESRFGFD